MLVVLVVASGAAWESAALSALSGDSGIVVLKRCVDVDDLLATASSGQAQAAVVALDSPGLDASAVEHLRTAAVRPVAVVATSGDRADTARLHASRIGIRTIVADDELDDLPELLLAPESPLAVTAPSIPGSSHEHVPERAAQVHAARTIVVWGAAGAPGRSTIAAGIAAELARRQMSTTLIDADPYGGTLAQRLGVLDEASGLLTATRLSVSGVLHDEFASTARALDEHLSLVSGLPRADRWVELRQGSVEHLIETAATRGHVVVDTGFSLEQDAAGELGARPGRNQATLGALGLADEVVVVGAADPVGLTRLARGLVEVRDVVGETPVRVVVNRMRPTLGWSQTEIGSMVADFAGFGGSTGSSGIAFVPDDPESVDRALATGRSLTESGASPISAALGVVVDALVGPSGPGDEAGYVAGAEHSRFRRRRAGRAHLR